MNKILIISYYWPPSGGSGVQRWTKLTKYLARLGIEVHVLTVDEKSASYMQIDESLNKDIEPSIQVHRTKSFEPINIYGKFVGRNNIPTAGFSNVDNSRLLQKISNAVRSNLFIPDPRKGWNNYAFRAAKKIILKEGIDTIITTSPPHSTQLIGLKLKRKLGVKWIADFRDPWTDIFYYKLLRHSPISKKIDKKKEKTVLENADKIITVSEGFKELFQNKFEQNEDKFDIIPNGFDIEDFNHLEKKQNNLFTISYTGVISDQYNVSSLLQSIAKESKQTKIKLQVVGKISETIKNIILAHQIDFEYIDTVPHSQVVKYQKNADLLILVIPDIQKANGIVPGKLFEYLASGNPILCLGPKNGDAAKIIRRLQRGDSFERNEENRMINFIHQEYLKFYSGNSVNYPLEDVLPYSRQQQAKELRSILESLTLNE